MVAVYCSVSTVEECICYTDKIVLPGQHLDKNILCLLQGTASQKMGSCLSTNSAQHAEKNPIKTNTKPRQG